MNVVSRLTNADGRMMILQILVGCICKVKMLVVIDHLSITALSLQLAIIFTTMHITMSYQV